MQLPKRAILVLATVALLPFACTGGLAFVVWQRGAGVATPEAVRATAQDAELATAIERKLVKEHIQTLQHPGRARDHRDSIDALGELGPVAREAAPTIAKIFRANCHGPGFSFLITYCDSALDTLGQVAAFDTLEDLLFGPDRAPDWYRKRILDILLDRRPNGSFARLHPIRALACETLSDAYKPRQRALVLRSATDSDQDLRQEAIDALATEDPPAMEPLIQFMRHPNPAVRADAANFPAIGRSRGRVTVQLPLISPGPLGIPNFFPDRTAQLNAYRKAIPALMELLSDPDAEVRKVAAQTLEALRPGM